MKFFYTAFVFLFFSSGFFVMAQQGMSYQNTWNTTEASTLMAYTNEDLPEMPFTKFKPRYRVDVLVSIYLDELVKNGKPVFASKIPTKALTGLNFYEGVKLASDALNQQDLKIDVYVHDIESQGNSVKELIRNGVLQNSDLVIGAVQGNDLEDLAAFANTKQINFVSAISPSNAGIQNNPFFTILQPTLATHCSFMRQQLKRHHPGGVITVFRRPKVGLDQLAFDLFINEQDSRLAPLTCDPLPNKEVLEVLFDSTRVNVIAMPIMDFRYAEKLLFYLSAEFPNYSFDIFGMPTWRNISEVRKPEIFKNMTINFSAPFYFDKTLGPGKALQKNYYDTFGSRPTELVYRGYETVYWFTHLLHSYGTIYNLKMKDNTSAIFTRYEIRPAYNDKKDFLFWENQNLNLFRYMQGNLQIK